MDEPAALVLANALDCAGQRRCVFVHFRGQLLVAHFVSSAPIGATYVSVFEADQQLSDDQVVYAVEINGETKGYPHDHLSTPLLNSGY